MATTMPEIHAVTVPDDGMDLLEALVCKYQASSAWTAAQTLDRSERTAEKTLTVSPDSVEAQQLPCEVEPGHHTDTADDGLDLLKALLLKYQSSPQWTSSQGLNQPDSTAEMRVRPTSDSLETGQAPFKVDLGGYAEYPDWKKL